MYRGSPNFMQLHVDLQWYGVFWKCWHLGFCVVALDRVERRIDAEHEFDVDLFS